MNISYTIILGTIGTALTFKLLKACWDYFNDKDINEVIFSNNRSACCTGNKSDSKCRSSYCMARHIDRMVEIINAAQHSVSLYMYILTIKELSDAIIKAHERGCLVRVVSESSMAYSTGSQMRCMSDAGEFHYRKYLSIIKQILQIGIPVILASGSTTLMHHKVCMIDTVPIRTNLNKSRISTGRKTGHKTIKLPSQGVVMTGSMNWTMQVSL